MFEIEFYEDKNGYSETEEWVIELDKKANTNKARRMLVDYLERSNENE